MTTPDEQILVLERALADLAEVTPGRAVRLLRAKAAYLEEWARLDEVDSAGVRLMKPYPMAFGADIALIARLLADHIERSAVLSAAMSNDPDLPPVDDPVDPDLPADPDDDDTD